MTEAAMATSDKLETEQPRRCPGMKADGSPCRVPSEMLLASGWCLLHDPARGADRTGNATLGGVKAGAKRRKGLDPDALGKLETPEDAMRISARLTIAAATGELAAPQVNAALSAVKEWRKAYEADVLDKRLDELERRGAR